MAIIFPSLVFRCPAFFRLVPCVLVVVLVACDRPSPQGAAPTQSGGPPPAQVGVLTVVLSDVVLQTELPGRLEASRSAQVRARATGILQQRLFREGSDVKAGQALFRIDAAPYQVSLQSAQANQARAEALLAQARSLVERYRPLVGEGAISRQEFANAQAAQQVAAADVAVAQAALQNARINLNYADVRAPIAGRIGRALVTEGALVGQGEATQLALIQQVDPMYVNFTQSAAEAMQLRRSLLSGRLHGAGAAAARVTLVLDDGSEHPQAGRLLFSDLAVDPGTGQVTLRAEVPNPNGGLLPGLYVRVRLTQASVPGAFTLPQQALTRSPQGDTVLVVDAEGKVAPRPVKVGPQQAGQWVILEGLSAGEQVMVDGFQKLRAGAPVKAVPWLAPARAQPVQDASAGAAQ